MKKKILILLSVGLLVGCASGENKKDLNSNEIVSSNEIKSEESKSSNTSNVEKNESEEKIKQMPIKTGKIGDFFEISILTAQEISKDEIIKEKILTKDELNKDKSYIVLKYKLKDQRPDPDFSAKPSYIDLIKRKDPDGKIIKREEIASDSKTEAIIREIIEVESIEKKLDLNFKVEDKNLNMRVIL